MHSGSASVRDTSQSLLPDYPSPPLRFPAYAQSMRRSWKCHQSAYIPNVLGGFGSIFRIDIRVSARRPEMHIRDSPARWTPNRNYLHPVIAIHGARYISEFSTRMPPRAQIRLFLRFFRVNRGRGVVSPWIP